MFKEKAVKPLPMLDMKLPIQITRNFLKNLFFTIPSSYYFINILRLSKVPFSVPRIFSMMCTKALILFSELLSLSKKYVEDIIMNSMDSSGCGVLNIPSLIPLLTNFARTGVNCYISSLRLF
jgi:hypothetical protein